MTEGRYHVCVTCGRLKHEELFDKGDCTCKHCYEDGRSEINYREAPDGDGFVLRQVEEDS